MAFLFFLGLSSLLFSSLSAFPTFPGTIPADPPGAVEPFLNFPPPWIPEQSSGVLGSPELAPAASTIAAPVAGVNQPIEQQQQQQLDDSVSRGSDQEQEQEQGALQPAGAVEVQPIGDGDHGSLQPGAGGVQPVGVQGNRQGQQGLGFGAQPLIDNTPFDSGSSRMGWGWFGLAMLLLQFGLCFEQDQCLLC